MPEGDAVWRTARRLHQALAGVPLVGSDLRVPALATVDLSGRLTVEVVPRGKHLLHRVEGGLTVHSHLRMDGSWRVLQAPAPPAWARRRHTTRALLWTADRVAVGELLGMLDVVPTDREDRVVGHLGPDLLDPAFDRELALANLARVPSVPVAQALLDQRNLAGIGTIFASEPLFEHAVSPWAPVGSLDPGQRAAVVDTARRALVTSCRLGRTATRRGSTGPEDTWVHGRVGLPCLRCGGTVRLAPLGEQPQQRVVFYCPACQGGLAPTDDGARQLPLGHHRRSYG